MKHEGVWYEVWDLENAELEGEYDDVWDAKDRAQENDDWVVLRVTPDYRTEIVPR